MRYLKNRQDFLTGIIEYKENYQFNSQDYKNSLLVREVFENDITWGGSLLGRLINSAIRKTVISAKSLRVNSHLKRLRSELDGLSGEYLNKEMEADALKAKIYALLEAMSKAAKNGEPIESFLGDGSKDSGYINSIIVKLNEIENFPDKSLLIKQLEKFRRDLQEMRDKGLFKETTEETEDEEEVDYREVYISSTIKILESVVKIHNYIVSGGHPSPTQQPKKLTKSDLRVGEIYIYTNKEGKKTKAKLLSLDHQIIPGPDKKFLTNDDQDKDTLENDNLVFVEFLNANGIDLPNKPTMAVDVSLLSDLSEITSDEPETETDNLLKVGVENKSENYIFESTENDLESKNAYNKILKYHKSSNIKAYIKTIQSIIQGSKEDVSGFEWKGIMWPSDGDVSKKIFSLGKQLLSNLSVHKPMDVNLLIKEAISFNDISKSISLFCIPILGFKDKSDLSEGLPKIKEDINIIISSFKKLSEVSPKIQTETKKKGEIQGEMQGQSQVEKYMLSYNRFQSINEDQGENRIYKVYRDNFSEDDERKWTLKESEKKAMSSKFENTKINIDTSSRVDPIVRIADIFGDAYRLFMVPQIPSGRPNGRISQRTWREYKYLGKGTGDWTADRGPNGPFASKVIYNKWEKGVMSIIQDKELRKIFANPNLSINGNPGAGQTLFKFMNDMIQDEALSDFDGARRRLLLKYFNIPEDKADITPAKPTLEGKLVSSEDVADPNQTLISQVVLPIKKEDLKLKKYDRSYLILKYKNLDTKKVGVMVMYIMGTITDREDKNILVFKYQIGSKEIFSYLKDGGLKSPSEEEQVMKLLKNTNYAVNIGFIETSITKNLTLKTQEIKEFSKKVDLTDMKVEVTDSWILMTVKEDKKMSIVNIKKEVRISTRPKLDANIGLGDIEDKYNGR